MEKFKQNYGILFNALLFSGLIIFLSGCGREKSAMSSVQYEKLRKQSIEIENGRTFASNVTVSETSTSNEVMASINDASISTNKPLVILAEKHTLASTVDTKVKTKLSLVQKVLSKKIVKKMNAGQQTAQLDQYLKYAIIFGIAGLLLSLFPHPFYFIGGILFLVGVVFLILWLLEEFG